MIISLLLINFIINAIIVESIVFDIIDEKDFYNNYNSINERYYIIHKKFIIKKISNYIIVEILFESLFGFLMLLYSLLYKLIKQIVR